MLLSLLGRFELRVGGREVATIPRKAKALLAYLAMQDGRPVPRETIADLLWTDRGAEQARHSLRQTLLVLRRALRDCGTEVIHNDGRTLAFVPGTVEVDCARLPRLTGSHDPDELAEAAQLHTRGFLEGFPAIAAEFDDWLARIRTRMTESASDVLERLIETYLRAGNADEAVRTAERMLALDPLREDLHRRLMSVYANAGRRSDAIRQYNACAEMLRRELAVAPAAETVALAQRIRADEVEFRADLGARDEAQQATVVAQPSDGPPWIAVLPFRAIGPDPVPGYFATGLVEDIVCMLATLREPIVISAHSTLIYQEQAIDLRRVGRELGARYVASGSIRKSGSWLRISVELAEANNGMVLWAQAYDIEARLLFDVQDSIVARIVGTWLPRLHEAELRRIRAKRPENMTAYDLVLQARDLIFRLTRQSFEDAAVLLGRAVSLDPNYASAHALMADMLNLRVGQGWSQNIAADAQTVDRMAQRAIASDPFNAKALAIYGHNRSYLYRDYDTAVKLFDRTLEAAPNDANGWMWSASTYAYIGDGPGSVKRAERALRLSPKDPFLFRYYTSLCLAHYTNGTYEEAVYWGRLGLQEYPQYTANLRFTTAALVELGRLDEARDMAKPVMTVQPEFRVQDVIDRHPYRELERRMKIARALIAAGLPE